MAKEYFKNVLIIRLSSLGDVVLTTPVVRSLKKKYPHIQIDYAISNDFVDIIKYNPFINGIFKYNKKLSMDENNSAFAEFMRKGRIEKYDYVIDLQNNYRSFKLRKGKFKKLLKYKKDRLNKLALVYLKRNISPAIHVVEKYFKAVEPINVKSDGLGLECWLRSDFERGVYSPYSKSFQNKLLVAIAPGAMHFTKRWQEEKFIHLIEKIGNNFSSEFYIIGGSNEKDLSNRIAKHTTRRVHSISGEYSILDTTSILDNCNVLITNDTGVMHLAASRNLPTVAIFGSTVKEFGFSPYFSPNIIVEKKEVKCRPCSHIGRADCPKNHFNCMSQISVDDVFKAFKKLLHLN